MLNILDDDVPDLRQQFLLRKQSRLPSSRLAHASPQPRRSIAHEAPRSDRLEKSQQPPQTRKSRENKTKEELA